MRKISQDELEVGKWYLVYRYPNPNWIEIHILRYDSDDNSGSTSGYYYFMSYSEYNITYYDDYVDERFVYTSIHNDIQSIFELTEEECMEHVVLNYC